jgi:hypothetical protein
VDLAEAAAVVTLAAAVVVTLEEEETTTTLKATLVAGVERPTMAAQTNQTTSPVLVLVLLRLLSSKEKIDAN